MPVIYHYELTETTDRSWLAPFAVLGSRFSHRGATGNMDAGVFRTRVVVMRVTFRLSVNGSADGQSRQNGEDQQGFSCGSGLMARRIALSQPSWAVIEH